MSMKTKTEIHRKQLVHLLRPGTYMIYAGLVALLFVMGTQRSFAQSDFSVKLYSGASCQSDAGNIYQNSDLRFSYGIGLQARFAVTEVFALQTGIDYLQKGMKSTADEIDQQHAFHYLELPLLARFSAGEKAGFKNGQRLYFAAGPYVDYLLDATRKQNDTSVSLNDEVKKYDLGLRFSTGFEFPLVNEKYLQLGVNYDMGLTEVYHSESGMQNKTAMLSLGLIF